MGGAAPTAIPEPPPLARTVAARLAERPEVVTVALGGSLGAGAADGTSDLDLYVYSTAPVPLAARAALAADQASRAEIGNAFWEPGDEWIDAASSVGVDLMYRTPAWIEEQLARVLVRHEASVGYSTCFWHNVLASTALYDRDGWYGRLQQSTRQPYPEPLRRAIVAKNQPILRATISSYRHQLELAVRRGDRVSVQHRTTALLASYFDLLFAVNRLPHPGEKRLLALALRRCARRPPEMARQIDRLIDAAGARPPMALLAAVDHLCDGIEGLLRAEGLLTST